jgi:hypothetical protein
MEIILTLTPEEYNLIHKGLCKLPIEDALPTYNKIIAEVKGQLNSKPAEKEDK